MADRRNTLEIWLGQVAFIVALGVFPALMGGCRNKQQSAQPAPPVTVSQPIRKDVTVFADFTGNAQAINSVKLVARVQGYLEKVLFQDGSMVKKGQPLFIIQQDTYQAQVQQAEAQILASKAALFHAETEYQRYSKLFKQNAAAETDVDNWLYQRDAGRANLLAAQAQFELAKLNLSYTTVSAPFNGRVDRRLVDPGNMVGVAGDTPLTEIDEIDPIYVYFTANENQLLNHLKKKRAGGKGTSDPVGDISMGLADDQGYPRQGQLDFAAIKLDQRTGTILLRGIFPNPDGIILPGMYARVRIPTGVLVNALLVPQAAVCSDQVGSYLLVVNDQNIVERRNVETGPDSGQMRVISKGLTGDERVVVDGLMRAIPGHPVSASEQQAAAPDNVEPSKQP